MLKSLPPIGGWIFTDKFFQSSTHQEAEYDNPAP